VNQLLCIIGQPGLDIDSIVKSIKAPSSTEAPKPASPAAATAVSAAPSAPVSAPTATASATVVNEGRIFASPLAKKIAKEKGIDLKYVQGTGEHGRITRTDLENYKPASNTSSTARAAVPKNTNFVGQVSFVDTPVSQMRKTIARRLSESLFTAPHFYLTMKINMDATIAARTVVNETAPVKISFNDFIVKAVALSLKQHPKVNSSWLGDVIRENHHVNIGIAVAVDEGLLVPVLRFADGLSLDEISVYQYLLLNHPELVEDEYFRPHDTAVIGIPQKAPETAIFRTESPIQLLERVKKVHSEWIKPGHRTGNNTHNVSATVSIREHEWKAVGEWMWDNKEYYNGLSVLPYDGGTYIQAPFEDCTKERYEELMKTLTEVDLSKVIEIEDNTDLSGEVACAGGACEVK
jgi:hypothetical protein